jgi:hypothetical protein
LSFVEEIKIGDCNNLNLQLFPKGSKNNLGDLMAPASMVLNQNEGSLLTVIKKIPELQNDDVKIEFCLSNNDFKEDLSNIYGKAINDLKNNYPNSVFEYQSEVCVDSSLIPSTDTSLDIIQTKFNSKLFVTLELKKALNTEERSNKGLDSKLKVTLRGALFGAAGALASAGVRPMVDYFSNKGKGKNLTLAEGAIIGALADIIQRASGRTNEADIAFIDLGASMVASLVRTKDPNAVGLAVMLSLYQLPSVHKGLDKLAEHTPEKLDWKIPTAMVGAFYLLSKTDKADPLLLNSNKVLGGVTFGALSYVVAANKKNETAGFIVASGVSLLDELCDAVTKKCKGRFSYSDLAANTAGIALGTYASRVLPAGTILTLYNKTLNLSLSRKW